MKENSGRRIIIDVNIWISFLLGGYTRRLMEIFVPPFPELLISEEWLTEFNTVVVRTKFHSRFGQFELKQAKDLVMIHGEKIQVSAVVEVCRDKKDNYLLSLCKDGKADFLITGDKDLLVLGQFEGTIIITLKQYLAGK